MSAQLGQTAWNMAYHRPTKDQQREMETIRVAFIELATLVDEHTPDGRDKAICFTKLEEALQAAMACIARDQIGRPK